MEFSCSFENYVTFWPVPILALVAALCGSLWIDILYKKAVQGELLSFPEQINQRAKYRKVLLFFPLCFCLCKAWSTATLPQFLYLAIAITVLCFITITDFEQHVIFDAMLLPLAITGIFFTLHRQLPITEHIVAGLGGGLLFFMLALLTKGAIGGGDIKLIATLGIWLGQKSLLSVIIYGAIAGGVVALLLLIAKKTTRKQYLAYGPYFAVSAIGLLLNWLRGLL